MAIYNNHKFIPIITLIFGLSITQVCTADSKEIFIDYSSRSNEQRHWLSKGLRMLEETAPKKCKTDQDCEESVNSFYVCVE